MLRLIRTTTSLIWLMMAIFVGAQNPALDTQGNPLESGVEYHVFPAATDTAGGLTLVDRNGSCPFYVGQEPLSTVVSSGFPVIFRPYAVGETIIRESRDLTIEFSAATTCVQSTRWTLSDWDPEIKRRFVIIGGDVTTYFRIDNNGGRYNLVFCPSESCPNCRFACGSAGVLIENGKRLLALDGASTFPFSFRRV